MLDDLPPFMTVEQAAEVLQLGRSKTYELTVEWERTSWAQRSPVRPVRLAEADPPRRPRADDRVDVDLPARRLSSTDVNSVVLGAGAAAVRREVGASAWAALEQLLAGAPIPVNGETVVAASIRDVAAGLGISKNAAHRAMRRLIDAGLIAPRQDRADDGRFVTGTYLLTIPLDVLAPVDALAPPTTSPASRSRRRPARSRRAATDQLSLLAP